MEQYIEVPVNILKALLITVARSDVRFYLEGICVDIKEGKCNLVSTDGHRMSYCPITSFDGFEDQEVSSILHYSALEMLLGNRGFVKSMRGNTIKLLRTEKGWKIDHSHFNIEFNEIDGKYPNWQRLANVRKEDKIDNAAFNLGYILDMHKIAKILNVSMPTLNINGANTPANINFGHTDFKSILMPVRT